MTKEIEELCRAVKALNEAILALVADELDVVIEVVPYHVIGRRAVRPLVEVKSVTRTTIERLL